MAYVRPLKKKKKIDLLTWKADKINVEKGTFIMYINYNY